MWNSAENSTSKLNNSYAYFDPHQRTSKMHDPVFNLMVSLLNCKIGLYQWRLFFTSFIFFQASDIFSQVYVPIIFTCLQTDCDERIVLMNSL